MRKQFIPLVIVLIVAMCIISEYTGEKEIIFPEILALAIGAWVMEKSTWGNKTLYFWLSPTIASLTGLIITRFLPYSPFLMIAGAFVLVSLQLKIMGSQVSPSYSAAILPILMHTQSWYYPLSVCLLTGIIACIKKIIDTSYKKDHTSDSPVEVLNEIEKVNLPNDSLINWIKMFMSILMVSAVALYFHWNYIVAPPLIVAFVELAKLKGTLHLKTRLVFISLVLSAFSGVIWLYLIYYFLHWPLWISGGLSVVSILLIFYILQFSFPPAAAITLLPIIIPTNNYWVYPFQILVGSAIFLLINLFWFKKVPVSKIENRVTIQ
ncbi:MAG TPA: HPP family protein [Clostridium sp.]|uniref:HPP family protein n=1 Tax=Clostridium sp. TaxID=1506 RepID=UPI002F93941B